jgi:hypothetical protein
LGEANRLAYFDISSSKVASAKTFDGKVFELRGALAVDTDNGEVKRVADIYYRVRSVRDMNDNIIAKRKKMEDELVAFITKE